MSSDNDKCSQCQETGHVAHYCPHIRCFDCNNYGHIIATPGIPTMTIETGTDSVNLDLTHITPDIGVIVIVILAEAVLDHFTGLHTIAPCITGAPAPSEYYSWDEQDSDLEDDLN